MTASEQKRPAYIDEIVLGTQRRARKFRQTLEKLADLDFPYSDCRDAAQSALDEFDVLYKDEFPRGLAKKDPVFVLKSCQTMNDKIADLHPIAGFITRSTNTRNAFEIFEPFREIARSLMGKDVQLVLSSEWNYIPFAYPFTMIEGVVFIGMPVVESGCSLFIPIAGHELGHALWRSKETKLAEALKVKISDKISGTLVPPKPQPGADAGEAPTGESVAVTRANKYALSQLEELYCDFIGFYLFGEAYLRAFLYVTAPGTGIARSPKYPKIKDRVTYLWTAANLPEPADDLFLEPHPFGDKREIEVADRTVADLVQEVQDAAKNAIADKGLLAEQNLDPEIESDFIKGYPSGHAKSLADVTRAVWRTADHYRKESPDAETIMSELDLLDEIALKTIELIEYKKAIG